MTDSEVYGLMAEFDDPRALIEAVRQARAAGYRRMDAYTPIPLHGLTEALGHQPSRLPWITFAGGLLGALSGYVLQYYISVVEFPMNVGGRPPHSWPAFIPIVFELAVLGASIASVLGMLALNGLPMPYHPVFNVPEFRLASRDRFFLCIEAADGQFDAERTRAFLAELHAQSVQEVPR
jgi:hypothetical protein